MTKADLERKKHALYQISKVLWHLDIFRRSFRELSGHACMAEACIFCALKELFSQLQFSQESALPPDALRRALAETFFDQQRFQLGCMDDAAECFENILLRIHFHIAREEAEDMCSARHCIPHQKFAMTLVEQSVCDACKATSEPLPFTQMVHYVSASALTDQARQMAASSPAHSDLFGQLLRRAGGMGDIRDCPSNCGAKIQICRSLMNRPEIVSVGIVWDSERPTLDQIMAVFATVGTTLRLGDVFHSVVDQRWALSSQHALVGVVTYYGKHYSTFFFHTKLRLWIYFDDATVREVGPRWEQVVEKCRRGRYQPLLLLYAALGGTPVNTQDAPKFITPVTNLATQNPAGRVHRAAWAYQKAAATAQNSSYLAQNGFKQEQTPCAVHSNFYNGQAPQYSGNNLTSQVNGNGTPQNGYNGSYNGGTQSNGGFYHGQTQNNPSLNNQSQNGPSYNAQTQNGSIYNQSMGIPIYNGQNQTSVYNGQTQQNGVYNAQVYNQNGYHQGPQYRPPHNAGYQNAGQSYPQNGPQYPNVFQPPGNGQAPQQNGFYGSTNGSYPSLHTAQASPVYHRSSVGQGAVTQGAYIRNGPSPVGQVPHLPPLSPGRRAVTPSPEKQPHNMVCSSPTRRAVTPNPEPTKQTISDYQNLSDMQALLMSQGSHIAQQQTTLYRSNSVSGAIRKPVQRSNSSDSERSSVFTESEGGGRSVGPRTLLGGPGTQDGPGSSPRRRDSGNWSGDRNSASSSSSTSMENPYLYIVGKMQQRGSVVPRSPLAKSDANGHLDAGYDSYSLSSTDSLPLQQGLKHSLQLAQIPEARLPVGQDCESLCQEAEELMERSRILEEQGDLEAALVLVQAACGKSRAAMDAPYNNPGNISVARMKHNSCVVALRSLQRKMTGDKDGTLEARHSRENSTSSLRGSSKGNHSRQSSRDSSKGQHSRQNSRELLIVGNVQVPTNNNNNNKIIREMLPQPVVGVHDLSDKSNNIEIYATLPKKKGGVMSRVRNRSNDSPTKNVIEDAEYLIYDRPGRKDKTPEKKEKRARSEERNKKPDVKPEPEPKTKSKQHKIRRKLLMGGLIRRKNRSMPDLREDEDLKVEKVNLKTQDDCSIKSAAATEKQLSGYLSEGHLEFTGNPNLERSRLMRKSFHGKVLAAAKVPPPPPLRTTSQLSKPKASLPFMVNDDPVQYANVQGIVTRAEIHQAPEESDELPPYPSPINSANHSRQASEEFPPPPEEMLGNFPLASTQQTGGLLKELQTKLQQKVDLGEDVVDFVRDKPKEPSFIRDLASKFDQIRVEEPVEIRTNFTTSVLKLTGADEDTGDCGLVRRKSGGKKKNVTFCDQVVLVATADDDEDDSYIPNPILERVLRSAMCKDDTKPISNPTETPVNQTMLQSRMQIPLCAPERSKPPPQYNPPPQCDAPRPYMQVPARAFEPNGRGSVNQPDKSASVRLGVNFSKQALIQAVQPPQNKPQVFYHPPPNRLPTQQNVPRPKLFPPYQQPPPPKQMPNKMEAIRPNSSDVPSQSPTNSLNRSLCNLCRKKYVVLPASYCPDCDFYMSRFRHK